MLENLKLSVYIEKFYESGYDNLWFMLDQMDSKYKINDKILLEEVGVKNFRHRNLILKKLKCLSNLKRRNEQQTIDCCII